MVPSNHQEAIHSLVQGISSSLLPNGCSLESFRGTIMALLPPTLLLDDLLGNVALALVLGSRAITEVVAELVTFFVSIVPYGNVFTESDTTKAGKRGDSAIQSSATWTAAINVSVTEDASSCGRMRRLVTEAEEAPSVDDDPVNLSISVAIGLGEKEAPSRRRLSICWNILLLLSIEVP